MPAPLTAPTRQRLARFAARYGFTVADDTRALMRQMVANGEADALVAERVWQELAKGLMETTPSAMFTVLRDCGALARIAPEIDALWGVPQRADYHPEIDCGVHTLMVLDYAAHENQPLPVRFAALTHDLGKALTPAEVLPRHLMHEQRGLAPLKALCERLRVPVECRELALLMCAEHTLVHRAAELRADTVLKLFKRCDALRRPARFAQLLAACRADARGRLDFADCPYPQAEYLASLLAAAQAVNAGEIAQSCQQPGEIALAVDTARVVAIEAGKRAWQAMATPRPTPEDE